MKIRWLFVLASFTLAPGLRAGERIDPHNPPQGLFSDDWMEIYFGQGKVGWAHSTLRREGDLIHTQLTMQLELKRAQMQVKIGARQATRETVAGEPRSFESELDASVMKSSMTGTIQDGKVRIVQSQFGMDQTHEYPFPKGAVMSWGALRESLIRGFEPGTEYTIAAYAPDLRFDDAVQALTKVGDWEEIGDGQRGQRVAVTMQTPVGSLETVAWVDETGMPVRTVMPMPGLGDVVMVASDEKSALADFVPPEFFMNTVISVPEPIDVDAARRIRYRISCKTDGCDLADLPDTDMQRIVARGDGWVELELTRQVHGTAANATPVDREKFAPYLGNNLTMNLGDLELIKLANQAAGDEEEPFALADRLRKFVTEYIEDKSLDVGFATANEVCRTKEGDCSEHGVLLAALGRIRGLPSRVAVGLAYVPSFGGQTHLFGYHMWTQFYINGTWYDVDAALRQTQCSPTRIAFAVCSLQDAGLAELSLPMLTKIGAIDLRVLEVENAAAP